MAKQSVFGIAVTEEQALLVVEDLMNAGFSENDISILFPDRSGPRHFAHEKHSKAPEGATAGAGTGGLVGGAVGLLAAMGTLAIPGVGVFMAAGPVFSALSGAAVGAAVGGAAGAFIGMGIPEYEAKRYEGKVREGNILISVHSEGEQDLQRAGDILRKQQVHDISVSKEASA